MLELDRNNPFQARVINHLANDLVGWLTTVTPGGAPQPSMVWFLWDGQSTIQVYSRESQRVRNLAENSSVSFHFNADEIGSGMIVLAGHASVNRSDPPADTNLVYLEKYAEGLRRLGFDAAGFGKTYSVPISVTFDRVRGF